MKTLYVIRHAKSSWAEQNQTDFNRKLNERGIENAPMMAKRLHQKIADIDYKICSPALRTTQTAHFFCAEFGWEPSELKFEPSIYEAPLSNLLKVVSSIPNESDSAVLFGHNFGVSLLVNHLTDDYVQMPTCAIATIELNIDRWEMISEGIGRLIDYDYPKKNI